MIYEYLTRSTDREMKFDTLDKAKKYLILSKDHEAREDEECDAYYKELEDAETLEDFAEIWNEHTDIYEDGSRLLVKSLRYMANLNPLMGLFELDAETYDEAKAEADRNITYNQNTAYIYEVNEAGNAKLVAHREWCPFGDSDECENPIDFGAFGYYSDWEDCSYMNLFFVREGKRLIPTYTELW